MHCITTNAFIGSGVGCKIHQMNWSGPAAVFVSLSQAQSWLEQRWARRRLPRLSQQPRCSASGNVRVDVCLFVIMLEVKNVLLLCCARVTGSGSAFGWHSLEARDASRVFWFCFLFCFFAFSLAVEESSGCKPARRFQSWHAAPRVLGVCYHIWQSLTFRSFDYLLTY